MYIQIMASLQKVKVKGKTYWRIVVSKRVNGKPRAIPVLHLGTADQILERIMSAPQGILRLQSFQHGDVAALKRMADALGIVDIINRHADQTARKISVGTTIFLAAINRAIRPRSKRSFATWAKGTSIGRLFDLELETFTSQFFWDQMEALPIQALERIEDELTRRVLDVFKIRLSTLCYDTTNFFTYIAGDNLKSTLAERGHNKQKRRDLKQFSLALLVSRDGQIPLCSHVYEGNEVDVAIFPDSLARMKQRLTGLASPLDELTLVYDKGNNSRKNQALIDAAPFSYVASLTPSHHRDLLAIPAQRYTPLDTGPLAGLSVFRCQDSIWDKERTLVLLISEKLRQGQIQGFDQQLIKRLRVLYEWKRTLAKPNSGPRSLENARKRIDKLLEGQHIKEVLKIEYHSLRKGEARLTWELDRQAKTYLENEVFGKRFLVTDRGDWATEEIIAAYNGLSQVEAAFRQLKNTEHLAVRPQYHWTDQKVRVHAFICLLALLLTRLLEREAKNLGFSISSNALLEKLATIRLAMVLRPAGQQGGRPKTEWIIEQNEDTSALDLFHQLVPQE
ncbi:MAG: IS1634 family transposase [Deltaproteobacteria bacterium]|nr:IS1634 family transposase [Deltaproteobacteria bacterium]